MRRISLFLLYSSDLALGDFCLAIILDDAVDLGGSFGCEKKMPIGDPCRQKLILSVGHACGQAVKHYVAVIDLAKYWEDKASAVLHFGFILRADPASVLFAVKRLDNAFFECHQGDSTVNDRRLRSVKVAKLGEGKLGGKNGAFNSEILEEGNCFVVCDVESEVGYHIYIGDGFLEHFYLTDIRNYRIFRADFFGFFQNFNEFIVYKAHSL